MVKLQNRRAGETVAAMACCGAEMGGRMAVTIGLTCGAVTGDIGVVGIASGLQPRTSHRNLRRVSKTGQALCGKSVLLPNPALQRTASPPAELIR